MYYTSRWKIEEQVKFIKYEFEFEDFRIINFNSINHLSFCLALAIFFLSLLIESKPKFYTISIKNRFLLEIT